MSGWDIGNYVTARGRAADSSRRKGRAVRNDSLDLAGLCPTLCHLLRLCGGEGLCFNRLSGGQAQDEDRSAFGFVLAGDLAAVILDDTVDGAQSEAGAFSDGFGGVERIEDAVRLFDAGTIVGEAEDDFFRVMLSTDGKQASAGFF